MIFVSSSCIKNDSIRETIVELATHGIKNIELSGGTKYYDGIHEDLHKLQKQYDLQYVCHAYFPPPKEDFVVNLAACNDKIYRQSIKHYEDCICMLKDLKCNVLSLHAGFLVEIGTDEIGKKISGHLVYDEGEAYTRFCYAYEHIADLCKKAGIKLYLENNVFSWGNYESFGGMNYFMMTDYQSIRKMQGMLDFDLLLDLAHLYVSSKTLKLDYFDQCKKLEGYVKWLHVSGNEGRRDEHKPLNDNSDIMKVYKKIKSNDINVTLESKGNIEEIKRSIRIIEV